MKKTRRDFLIEGSKVTAVAYFAALFWACENENTPTIKSNLEVAKLFSNHVILQRDQPIPVWGWATPAIKIHLFFNEKKYTTRASQNGKWIFELPALPTGGTYKMKISQGDQIVEISDILIGDVYLCSGQSNMEWGMSRTEGVEEEIANASDSRIRHFKIPVTYSKVPAEKLSGGEWQVCSPETLKNFSAAAYFFAKNMRLHHDIPVGLVNATKGGSHIKMWMHPEVLNFGNGAAARKVLHQIEAEAIEKSKILLAKKLGALPLKKEDSALENFSWAAPTLDDSDWKTIQLPKQWGDTDFMQWTGVMWFRKTFFLEKIPENESLEISLGKIDDTDQTFLNGKKIGEGKNDYDHPRTYSVDTTFLKKGKNVLAIRVEDFGQFGGIFGEAEDMFFKTKNHNNTLAGDWKIKIEAFHFNSEPLFEQGKIPCVLYNAMIHPLRNFSIKAMLWYQGESDVVPDQQVVFDYRFLLMDLIADWRKQFGKSNMAFVYAQISNLYTPQNEPIDSVWARMRESQLAALQLKNTAQVINIDSGKHENSMHPQNKPELGRRFSLAVRRMVFEEKIIASGPVFFKMKKHKNELHLFFKNTGKTLLAKATKYGGIKGKVMELAIAGADQKFVWAENRIENNKIIAWHPSIAEPVAARYAWADNPLKVNLYNEANLPATPFRTDDW